MEKKIKTLRIVLLIGTIILFIGGFSFLFVKSVDPWIRTITMGLITAVLLFLSIYEEYIFKFKGDSITSYVFANVSTAVTFLCITAYKLFGEWYSLFGEGSQIYIASFMTLVAILILIAAVKYKVYKLIELSIWFLLIAIAFVLLYFDVSELYIFAGLLGITLLYNIIRITGYSKWLTFALLIFGLLFFGSDDTLMACIIAGLELANVLAILYRSKKAQWVFVIFLIFPLIIMSHTCFNPFVGLLIALGIDLLLIGTKAIDRSKDSIAYVFLKITYQLTYFGIIAFSKVEGPYLFIVPSLVLLISLIEALVFKDDGEKYILPFKAFYCSYAVCYNLPLDFMKQYMALFVANIVILLLYLLTSNKTYRITGIVLLSLINFAALFTAVNSLIGNIVMTILFAMDFYIVYVKEEKIKVLTTILFILQGFFAITIRFAYCPESLIATALMYGIFICITFKNKALFAASLFGFLFSVSLYLKNLGLEEPYLSLVTNTLAYVALVMYQFICVDTEKGKSTFLGVTNAIHIIIMLIWPHNVLLKVFALVESIMLIVFSMKNDEHKHLFDLGIIGVIASLLFILGTFESLPKSLYLIIVAMTIIITIPILITRYIKKQKQEALEAPKEEVKVEEQPTIVEEVKQEKPKTTKKAKTTPQFCSECGSKLLPESAFCSNCGTKIK